MNESAAREAYDLKERARIQRALRRYMEAHRIGTPTLQLRIMEADARGRELPLSTLQRFVTGSHRTSDAYVDMCRRFLESVGAPEAAPDFGAALAAYFGDGETEPAAIEAYAGSYIVHAKPWEASNTLPYAYARFESVPGKPFIAVAETAHDMPRLEAPARRHRFEGALVFNAPFAHMLLRSCITRQPKSYALRRTDGSSARAMFEGPAFFADLENNSRQLSVRFDTYAPPFPGPEGDEVPL